MEEPVEEPVDEPVEEPVDEPVDEPVEEPVKLFIGKPVTDVDIPFYKSHLLFFELATMLTLFTHLKSLFRST